MFKSIASIAVVLVAATTSSVEPFKGFAKGVIGTDYLPNQCQYSNIWGHHIAAGTSHFAYVLAPEWNKGALCGQCAQVRYTGSSTIPNRPVTVMITSFDDNDKCPVADSRCQPGSILLSTQAYRDMFFGVTPSSAQVEWDIVGCPEEFVEGNMEFHFHQGTSNGFISVQPRNFARKVTKLDAILPNGQVKAFSQPGDIIKFGTYMTLIPDSPEQFARGFTIRAYGENTNRVIYTYFERVPKGGETVEANGQFDF